VACHLLVHLKFLACSMLPSDVYKVEAYSFGSFLDDVRSCSIYYGTDALFSWLVVLLKVMTAQENIFFESYELILY
jgi:hypothetical protein